MDAVLPGFPVYVAFAPDRAKRVSSHQSLVSRFTADLTPGSARDWYCWSRNTAFVWKAQKGWPREPGQTASAVSVPTDSIFVARSSGVTSRSSPALRVTETTAGAQTVHAKRRFVIQRYRPGDCPRRHDARCQLDRQCYFIHVPRRSPVIMYGTLGSIAFPLSQTQMTRVLKWKTGMKRRCKSATARSMTHISSTSRPAERSELSHWRQRLGGKLDLLLADSLRIEPRFMPHRVSPLTSHSRERTNSSTMMQTGSK